MNNKISIYVHIPFCKSKCHYCDFASFCNKEELITPYFESLKKEISLRKKEVNGREVETIYFGGGTPSFVDSKFICDTLNIIKKNFSIKENAEITIEANPSSITKEKLEDYINVGFNRISIGLQSTNNTLLKTIGRIHTYETFLEKYSLCKEAGFKNINVDLMFSLPNQTYEDLIDSVEKVLGLDITHISLYSLILEEHTRLYEYYIDNNIEPNEDLDRKMYNYIINKLENTGFHMYEISNFSKKGYESRHNLNCWEFYDYMGFGSCASSFINSKRSKNIEEIENYIKHLETNTLPILEQYYPGNDILLGDYIMLGLRKTKGINIEVLNKKFNINFLTKYEKELDKLLNEDLIIVSNKNVKLTRKGLDFANRVMVEFI